ncbi:PGN_0703 family putative restriction endonuclease [Selenomonas ruminantium]|uniref:Uncharacterized protein n=1 Tax=Selenomonas ruminantium TaxID=971 RepID=A0A1H3Z519_SELRU|nr:hypothetical protein [Selenomonas ruminantium]SEA18484.1 hypothetical protein SAMN05660648_02260 [Selenomonas ruminantium]
MPYGTSTPTNKLRRFVRDVIRQRAKAALKKSTPPLDADNQNYYFTDYRENLLDKMSNEVCKAFAKGSGNELQRKMAAVYSSSAMTFNIFGNGPVEVKKNTCGWSVGKYTLQYERQLPVLKRGGKANLDAQLTNEKEIIFFEMKMQEWLFYKPSKLAWAYLHDEKRYYNGEMFPVVKNLIENITPDSTTDLKNYSCKYKHFDAFQIIKHIIGIYNGVVGRQDEFTKAEKITLVVGYWTVPLGILQKMPKDISGKYKEIEKTMQKEMNSFDKLLPTIKDRFKAVGVKFDLKVMTVEEIITALGKANNKKIQRYL